MSYKHNIDSCFGECGISANNYDAALENCTSVLRDIKQQKYPLFNSNYDSNKIDEIQSIAAHIKNNFKHLVILGTGGSTLCGQTLTGFVESRNKYDEQATKIHFMDNIDPDSFLPMLAGLPIDETHFLAISKSGTTLETISQFVLCLAHIAKQVGDNRVKHHISCISDPMDNPLRRLASQYNIAVYDHEVGIGGRFSLLTNVGLIPAAVAGIDINKVLAGASSGIDKNFEPNSQAAKGAALNYAAMENGLCNNVLMTYADNLKKFGVWYRQIWSESLGKNGSGTTPINAIGTLDQHSQLQLYLDGTHDKLFTFIIANINQMDCEFDNSLLEDSELSYLKNCKFSDVIKVSGIATRDTLILNHKPVRSFEIDILNEEIFGELIMHFIFETIIMAGLMKINAFDQPAVEEGKKLARKLLSGG